MIHYHGLPITPGAAAAKVLDGRHAFVCFKHPEQLEIAIECCQSFAADNGAFSAWMSGKPIDDWQPYYDWIFDIKRNPGFDFAVIPDVIDGGEYDNDLLLMEWPHDKLESAPVWHMHESIDRLVTLANEWPRVCIGSSGEYSRIGTPQWWNKIGKAMNAICDEEGYPSCKLHGLRMLDPDIFTKLPLSSADSTNIGRNIGIDKRWNGAYQPPDKDWRALVLASRIESQNSISKWHKQPIQDYLL